MKFCRESNEREEDRDREERQRGEGRKIGYRLQAEGEDRERKAGQEAVG
jgi:hypothetical protein